MNNELFQKFSKFSQQIPPATPFRFRLPSQAALPTPLTDLAKRQKQNQSIDTLKQELKEALELEDSINRCLVSFDSSLQASIQNQMK
jgi:hypothetical protein